MRLRGCVGARRRLQTLDAARQRIAPSARGADQRAELQLAQQLADRADVDRPQGVAHVVPGPDLREHLLLGHDPAAVADVAVKQLEALSRQIDDDRAPAQLEARRVELVSAESIDQAAIQESRGRPVERVRLRHAQLFVRCPRDRRPTTVYVAVSLDQLPFVMRLLNLFFQQAVTLLAQSMPTPDEPHPVLFLLDEFASLGRMDVLKESLAFLAGYGVRVCTIVQGLGQLDELYGRSGRESILQNSAIQAARYVSDRLGTKTIRTLSRTFPGGGRLATKTYGTAGCALLACCQGLAGGSDRADEAGTRKSRGERRARYPWIADDGEDAQRLPGWRRS
jgi:hypothetical protein